MRKSDLVKRLAEKAQLSVRQSDEVLAVFIEQITDTLAVDERVKLAGFGEFRVKLRAQRIGRHPQTGQSIQMCESKYVVFKASKSLKNAVNSAKA